MTWEIVLGIIALIGVFGTVAGWTGKLSKTLATLEATLRELSNTLNELKDTNRETHRDIYDKLRKHEGRISRLESKHEND